MSKIALTRLSLAVLFLFINLPVLSGNYYAQNTTTTEIAIPDSVCKNMINDFLKALNSGNRVEMQKFIQQSYDKNVIGRFPIDAVISLNMAFYYETGGLGYSLHNYLPPEENLIVAQIFNELTKTCVKIKIPVSKNPDYKINYFIKTEPVDGETCGGQSEVLSEREFVKRLDILFKKMEEDQEYSGTVLIAKNGNILFSKALAEASKAYKIPNRIDTKFNIASLGKMFTGTAITQLVEEGKLSFDDYINKYVPADWLNPEVSSQIQVKHLLTHTSGLGDYFRDAYQQCSIPFFRDLNDYKTLIADDTLNSTPGTKFSYSNTGMLLLGVIIENITGDEYFDYLRKNIFEPAGMMNTGGYYKDRPVENSATGYTKIYEQGELTWDNHQFTRIMRGSPSGGVYSTAEDMMKFDIALRSNKLLSPEYSEILFEGRPELNASFHSYGFFVSSDDSGRIASHKGDGRGVNCQFEMFLDNGFTVIVLSNYSQPSANIVTNVINQLISAM